MIENKIFVCIFFSLFFTGCNSVSDCMMQAGDIDSVVLNFRENPKNISIYNNFDVFIQKDSVFGVVVVANKTLLKNIKVELDNNKLEIKDLNDCYFFRNKNIKNKIILKSPRFDEIFFYGVVNVRTIDTLNDVRVLLRFYSKISSCDVKINCTDMFLFELWNVSGNFRISGSSTYLWILSHGVAEVQGLDFKSNYVTIEHRSLKDIYITPLQSLDANLFDIGNLYYKGNPSISIVQNKTGKAIRID